MKLAAYLPERTRFKSMLDSDDAKYLAFQLWQEGIARYTEYRVADLAASSSKPSKEFRALADYTPFRGEADRLLSSIEKELSSVRLDESKRTAFYALGAAEGLVLDTAWPDWRNKYFDERFSLDGAFRLK